MKTILSSPSLNSEFLDKIIGTSTMSEKLTETYSDITILGKHIMELVKTMYHDSKESRLKHCNYILNKLKIKDIHIDNLDNNELTPLIVDLLFGDTISKCETLYMYLLKHNNYLYIISFFKEYNKFHPLSFKNNKKVLLGGIELEHYFFHKYGEKLEGVSKDDTIILLDSFWENSIFKSHIQMSPNLFKVSSKFDFETFSNFIFEDYEDYFKSLNEKDENSIYKLADSFNKKVVYKILSKIDDKTFELLKDKPNTLNLLGILLEDNAEDVATTVTNENINSLLNLNDGSVALAIVLIKKGFLPETLMISKEKRQKYCLFYRSDLDDTSFINEFINSNRRFSLLTEFLGFLVKVNIHEGDSSIIIKFLVQIEKEDKREIKIINELIRELITKIYTCIRWVNFREENLHNLISLFADVFNTFWSEKANILDFDILFSTPNPLYLDYLMTAALISNKLKIPDNDYIQIIQDTNVPININAKRYILVLGNKRDSKVNTLMKKILGSYYHESLSLEKFKALTSPNQYKVFSKTEFNFVSAYGTFYYKFLPYLTNEDIWFTVLSEFPECLDNCVPPEEIFNNKKFKSLLGYSTGKGDEWYNTLSNKLKNSTIFV